MHVTLTVPHVGRPAVGQRRVAGGSEESVRAGLADLARVAGPDARRVVVNVEFRPSAPRRWWAAWAWRRGVGGACRPSGRERHLDELLTPVDPPAKEPSPCEGTPHVTAAADGPLSWDVIDDLDGSVSAGREAHLVLGLPRSPVTRDPELHVLWQRRMALEVADREREVAQLWPRTSLVRIEVVVTYPTAYRGRLPRGVARLLDGRRR